MIWTPPAFDELTGRDLYLARVAAKSARWREANREKSRSSAKAYAAANRAQVNANRRANRKTWTPERLARERLNALARRDPAHDARKNSEWRAANRERANEITRLSRLRRAGCTIDAEQLRALAARGCCEMCGGTHLLCIDHDHTTGKPRGLLCRTCNAGIGSLKECPKILRAALRYLKKHRS